MKKKLLSIVLGICMCFTCLFSFTSCSLVKHDNTKSNKEVILKIGDKSLTRSDIVSAFYTYYQNNSSYFAYYDDETIEESFYQWAIVRQMLSDKANSALYDAEKNPNGIISYSEEDAEEVWNNVLEYFYSQVSSYEESIYENDESIDEDHYPSWISDEEDEEDETFTPYTKPEIKIVTEKSNVGKLTDEQVKSKIGEVKEYIFEYVSEQDAEGNDIRVAIDETNYKKGARNSAYANYLSSLVSSAKSSGTSTDENVCLENEVLRIYEAYYNSQITSNFQSYYLNEYITNYNGEGDKDALSNSIVVKSFLEEYYTQKQSYSSESEYIEVMESDDGASLVLYSYNGQNYFFSVQHILVQFTDYLMSEVKKLDGYNGTTLDDAIAEGYRESRNALANNNKSSMLTEINDETGLDSLTIVGDYYYFDETLKNDKESNYGYIKLEKIEDVYKDADGNEYDEEQVQHLATVDDIYEAFSKNYSEWTNLVSQYLSAGDSDKELLISEHTDMEYVFETAEDMRNNGYSDSEINEKLASLLFVELQWVYSSDSLGNELSNKIGYIVSNYADENGSWVADFANGARELVKKINDENFDFDNIGDITNLLSSVVSDYGVHIMKIENIYKAGSSINGFDSIIEELLKEANDDGYQVNFEVSDNNKFVDKIARFMKKTYVSTSSNQTLFDYFYDQIFDDLVGTDSSSGTYFVAQEYKWLSEYFNLGKIEYVNKLSYDELIDALN